MFYGGWREETSPEIVDDELISISFLFSPDEPPPDQQHFALRRPLSSIFSTMFNEATTNVEGEITALRVEIDPSALASLIPDDYEGEILRIWRLHVT